MTRFLSDFARLSVAFGMLKRSGCWSVQCIGSCIVGFRSIESKRLNWRCAGVPELDKGAGLKLRCLALRGFESLPLHQSN